MKLWVCPQILDTGLVERKDDDELIGQVWRNDDGIAVGSGIGGTWNSSDRVVFNVDIGGVMSSG